MLQIIEVGEIAWQGKTQPVFCRAEDGHEYIVKGQHAGCKALIAELVAHRLGTHLGLPIPACELLEIPLAVFDYGANHKAIELLGTGVLFGSRKVDEVKEISYTSITRIPQELRARILAFDWWIANPDRILGEAGGNPNLLWHDQTEAVHVIDHNLAFEPEEMNEFWQHHIFRDSVSVWTERFRHGQEQLFEEGIQQMETVWDEIPQEWTEASLNVTLNSVKTLLWKFKTDPANFWRL